MSADLEVRGGDRHSPANGQISDPAASPAGDGGTRRRESGGSWLRYAPILLIALGAAAAIFFFGDLLSFETLKENREALIAWRDANLAIALAAFFGAYVLVVAFSIPGALWMTLGGGFLFGLWPGGPLIVLAATVGATLIFLAARTSLGESLRKLAGPWLERMRGGFQRNAASYMLVMRLAPVVPFFVANLAPAFLGARLWTFVWTTALGIIPATLVYTWVGAGLGELIDQGGDPNLGVIFEPHILGPLIGLAVLAALPIALRRGRSKSEAAAATANEATRAPAE